MYVHGAFTHPKHVFWETQLLQEAVQAAIDERETCSPSPGAVAHDFLGLVPPAPIRDKRVVRVIPFLWPCNTANLLDVFGFQVPETDAFPRFKRRYSGDSTTAAAVSASLQTFLTQLDQYVLENTCQAGEQCPLIDSSSNTMLTNDFVLARDDKVPHRECNGGHPVPRSITIIAHSIGNEVLTRALRDAPPQVAVAPDANNEQESTTVFRTPFK